MYSLLKEWVKKQFFFFFFLFFWVQSHRRIRLSNPMLSSGIIKNKQVMLKWLKSVALKNELAPHFVKLSRIPGKTVCHCQKTLEGKKWKSHWEKVRATWFKPPVPSAIMWSSAALMAAHWEGSPCFSVLHSPRRSECEDHHTEIIFKTTGWTRSTGSKCGYKKEKLQWFRQARDVATAITRPLLYPWVSKVWAPLGFIVAKPWVSQALALRGALGPKLSLSQGLYFTRERKVPVKG